jgi:hypothetical protein
MAWKVLLPISLLLLVVMGGLTFWWPRGFAWDRWVWPVVPVLAAYLVYGAVQAQRWSGRRQRELAA